MTVQERLAALREQTPVPPTFVVAVARRVRALTMAVAAGVLAGLVGWLIVAVPVLLAWVGDPFSSVSVWQSLGIAGNLWALAHGGLVSTPDVSVRLSPLLLTVVPILLTRYAVGQVLAEPPSQAASTHIGGFAGAWTALRATELVVFVAGYAGIGLLVAGLAGLGQAGVPVAPLLPGLVWVPLLGIVLALVRERRVQEHPTIDAALRWLALRTPMLIRRGLAPAGEALAGLMVAALLVVVALVVVRIGRIGTLTQALDAGWTGIVVLSLGQLLLLPNMLIWALGWLTGPGVSVGSVHIGWQQATGGDLPLVPVLAALPEPGALPELVWLVSAVPVLAGAWLGWRGAGSAARLASWWSKAQVALAAALMITAVVLVLSWLASGGLTPGLLGTVGVQPLRVAGALLGELLLGATVMVTVLHLARRRL
ncbi:MAG: cell division protein PerM [Ornithinimicrobium sp.]|uniref:cell division protein PerM n=1 Tax=Ornithinimicrobium sp. TaxID=1977084 RepID=UPI003D9B23D6